MCGFVGILDEDGVSGQALERMTQAIAHRGPDDSGFLFLDREQRAFDNDLVEAANEQRVLGMGFRRLSVLDLSHRGHQPMVSEDGRYAITFNGEIYNFAELSDDLRSRGHEFRSTTDTEVLLQLFVEHREQVLSKLNGMFAFAVYDRRARELFLARDRLGIKPLYYKRDGARFMYASEPKAFLFHPECSAELSAERLSEYLLFRYVAEPNTMLSGVRSLQPGSYMVVQAGDAQEKQYWSVPDCRPEARTREAAVDELDELMESSVRYQLISDVKVGCQLSGGVDSSLISHWASRLHEGLFDSVSIGFADPQYSEQPYIDHVNDALGLRGHTTVLDAETFAAVFRAASWHSDAPLSHANSIGIFLLAKEARRHVTVLLSGEGADEVFGGYQRYYRAAWLERLDLVPGAWRLGKYLGTQASRSSFDRTLMALPSFRDVGTINDVFPAYDDEQAFAARSEIWDDIDEGNRLERLLRYEQRTFMVDLLMRQDRMCMAHGVENRVPFLDHRVVEFSRTLSTEMRASAPLIRRPGRATFFTKRILKELAARAYGREFAYRPKSGFPLPLSDWFASGSCRGLFADAKGTLRGFDCFRMREIERLFEMAQAGSPAVAEIAWTLLALAVWWEGIETERHR